ncbi:MAG: TrkA family potassium uptake protein [Mediterranea massiliensis]|nr:TrkA family potassium uptake protein [Mediterranea massiliensis]
MKYLIIGLGNFGKTLAEELTDKGHDVIGVDINKHCVESIKDRIAVAYIMDTTERSALKALPLHEIDSVVVAIGQSMDHSLRTVAALKELKVSSIYARALDQTHQSILQAMNIDKVFIPECYAARLFADRFMKPNQNEMI